MSPKIIESSFTAVARRNRVQCLLESLISGIFWAELLALPFIVLHLCGLMPGISVWPLAGAAFILGLIGGGLFGAFVPLDPKRSARQIDSHYRLKDRILTAMHLMKTGNASPIALLQLEDAAEHAAKVDPKAVHPYRAPKNLLKAVAVVLLAVGLCAIEPLVNPNLTLEAAQPIAGLVNITEEIKNDLLDPLEELAKENPEEPQLKELSEEMKELMEKLLDTTTEPKEMLATLSQMESAVQKAMNEFDLEAMDASLQDAGAALSNAESTRAAGQAMKEGNYAKAGEELRKMDASELSKQERKAVSDQLKQAGEGMERRNMSDLAKLTEKMAKELEESDCEGCKDSACQLAGACEKQGLRKGICQSLANKLSLLGMCKSECSGSCNGNKNGGDGTKKSTSPSSSWGTGAAGDPRTGEETELGGNRQMQKLDGIQGAGPSEVETIKTAEGDDAAPGRAYKDVYSEYRKISESVLETEPIPLGQRQIIRKYFESIRSHEGEQQ